LLLFNFPVTTQFKNKAFQKISLNILNY